MDLGLVVTAALLGVTHAVEPDHVAGIVGLGGESGRHRAAVVGAAFAAGHAVLVVGWLTVATLVLGAFPAAIERVGDTALGGVLLLTAVTVAWDARRTLRADATHRHSHPSPVLARADGGTGRLLVVGLVGALFTLSPPLTMLGFVTAVLPTAGPAGAWLAVAAYTGSIVATMATVGVVGSTAVGWLGTHDVRYVAAGKVLAALVLAALGVSTLA